MAGGAAPLMMRSMQAGIDGSANSKKAGAIARPNCCAQPRQSSKNSRLAWSARLPWATTTTMESAASDDVSSDIDEPYVDIDREVGVGPHPLPWPTEAHFDVELLASGDRRNVIDRYRYWTMEAIIADLDTRRHGFHIAIENFKHDMNIGTVVRNANAFMAAEVHIVGRRRWNRRGAMVTDRYQHVRHHPDVPSFAVWAADNDLPIIGIDNVEGSVPLETARLPTRCVLLMGQEGAGLSEEALAVANQTMSIAMWGSTRSINAGVASGIAMYAWALQHALDPSAP